MSYRIIKREELPREPGASVLKAVTLSTGPLGAGHPRLSASVLHRAPRVSTLVQLQVFARKSPSHRMTIN